ncbi:replication-relaxation family protein [Kitasatospora sp. NPDC101157]|uniref:replication-relaxation family protein n=1 Tax=Kitasatospora sp. NPDC101157 TaxID=3364098 RepID=UPI003805436E
MRGRVLMALAVFQRATARELWPLVVPNQRVDRSVRDALGDLEEAGKVRKELTLRDGRHLWCLTPSGRRDAAALLPAGTKLAAARPQREKPSAAYSEHALDVAATAGHLAKAGFGYLAAYATEVEHRLPGRRSLFADLVVTDPGADVPVLMVEVDRENEGNGTLVAKLHSYRAWCQLPAKGTTKRAFEASLQRSGARTHDLRLWSATYPPTGREGLPPVALVLEAGRKRNRRPGAPPLTAEQKKAKAKADHERLLRHIREIEAASEPTWHAPAYRGEETTARDYHRALPVVATTMPLLRKFGAGGPIWWRFGGQEWTTLIRALDNEDGVLLLEQQQEAARRAREAERERVERERRRPACTRCKARFSDERWAEQERADTWDDDGLCAGCRQADAAERARQEAEREQAAAEAVAAEAKRASSWWRRT